MEERAELAVDPKSTAPVNGTVEPAVDLVVRFLDAVADVIPYEVAAVLELRGSGLAVQCARGPHLADGYERYGIELDRHPTLRHVIESRRARILGDDHHSPLDGDDPFAGLVALPNGHTRLVAPLFSGERAMGVVLFVCREPNAYSVEVPDIATMFGQFLGLALTAAEHAVSVQQQDRMLQERIRLLEHQSAEGVDPGEAFENPSGHLMRRLVQMARQVAMTDSPVLITGESGTGKDLLARAIHGWGRRVATPFIKIGCAAVAPDAIERQLFGEGGEDGATHPGRVAVAEGGTLYVDDVEHLPRRIQEKLLRLLQEGTYQAVNDTTTRTANIRVIAASHTGLDECRADGRFREDLYYGLNVFPLALPPLRRRKEDLPSIAQSILTSVHRSTGRGPWSLSSASLERLAEHSWPGNVRELRCALMRSCLVAAPGELEVEVPGRRGRRRRSSGGDRWPTLKEHDREYILRVLRRTGGKIYGKNGAAAILGLPPTTLQSRLAKLGISRQDAKNGGGGQG